MPLETLVDKQGEIVAVVEYWIVDKDGSFNDTGNYVFINEFVVSRSHRHNGMVGKLALAVMQKVPQAKYGYFQRRKHGDRVRIYSKRQWLKIANRYNKEE